MFIAYAVVAILLAVVLTLSSVLMATRNEKIVESMTAVGVPDSVLNALSALKALGAIGLIVGLWVPWLGVAAGIGVTLYFLGAVASHLRAGDKNFANPAVLGLFAVATIVLRVLSM